MNTAKEDMENTNNVDAVGIESTALFAVPYTLAFTQQVKGSPLEKYWSAVSRMEAMEKTLRFILDECDWEEYRGGPCGGGDERIGKAIRKVLSASD